jgi:hypothetical protein
MWISGREASRIFEAEARLSRQQSRRVLLAGVAGPSMSAGRALLYDDARVHEAARRPERDHADLLRASPSGVFVVRIGRDAALPTGTWHERAARISDLRDVGPLARFQTRVRIQQYGPLPFVGTVCGYPVLLALLTDLPPVAPGRVRAELTDPELTDPELNGLELNGLGTTAPATHWTDLLCGRRLITSPGPPWLLLGSQPFLGRATRGRERPPFPCAGHPRPAG